MNSNKELKFYVFENYEWDENKDGLVLKGYNVLIVTKDDKTYTFGKNSFNQLGFGNNRIVKELCDQQIIDFSNGKYHCIARNSSGKIYCWDIVVIYWDI
jgi:alpha-tubulin suppressor-like RCC1 family protein